LGAVKNPRRTPASEILIASELGRDGRIFEEKDVIRLLKQAIEREGDQGAFARHHGIDRSYLNLISRERTNKQRRSKSPRAPKSICS
jgi:hypothetical protein